MQQKQFDSQTDIEEALASIRKMVAEQAARDESHIAETEADSDADLPAMFRPRPAEPMAYVETAGPLRSMTLRKVAATPLRQPGPPAMRSEAPIYDPAMTDGFGPLPQPAPQPPTAALPSAGMTTAAADGDSMALTSASVEGLAELVRPLLKQWFDENLSGLVEQALRSELSAEPQPFNT